MFVSLNLEPGRVMVEDSPGSCSTGHVGKLWSRNRMVTGTATPESSLYHKFSSRILVSRGSHHGRGRPDVIQVHSWSWASPSTTVILSYLGHVVEPEQDNNVQDFGKQCSNSVQLLGQVLLLILSGWFNQINLYKDVLPFQLCVSCVPHIVVGPLRQLSEHAIWTCCLDVLLLPPAPTSCGLTLSYSAFGLNLKTLCLATPSLCPVCTRDRQLQVLSNLYGDNRIQLGLSYWTGLGFLDSKTKFCSFF